MRGWCSGSTLKQKSYSVLLKKDDMMFHSGNSIVHVSFDDPCKEIGNKLVSKVLKIVDSLFDIEETIIDSIEFEMDAKEDIDHVLS